MRTQSTPGATASACPGSGCSAMGYSMGSEGFNCLNAGKVINSIRYGARMLRRTKANILYLNMAREQTFTITELAREFDITPRAIRYYEDQGLISPERAGQNRVYSKRDRTRLKLTLRGRRLGLSLAEIRELIDMYDVGRDQRSQLSKFLAVLARQRAALERQREDIVAVLEEIGSLEARAHELLGEPAGRKKNLAKR
jgi:DNA-binding transcriptional MerR regulator